MNKINGTNLILIITVIGLILYINFCQEQDYLTKSEGEALAKKSEQVFNKVDSILNYLPQIDSSKQIINYYTNEYTTIKTETDSILDSNPLLADSLFRYWVERLRSEQSPLREVEPSDW